MSEKIKHCVGDLNVRKIATGQAGKEDAPSSPAPGSRRRAGPRGPRCPGYRPTSRFLRSGTKKGRISPHEDTPQIVYLGYSHLERDVVVSDANLELLLADDILLGPVGVVFPKERVASRSTSKQNDNRTRYSLGDLARLNDPLELLHDQRADPHYQNPPPVSLIRGADARNAKRKRDAHSLCGSNYRSGSSSCSHTADVRGSTQTPRTRARACPNVLC